MTSTPEGPPGIDEIAASAWVPVPFMAVDAVNLSSAVRNSGQESHILAAWLATAIAIAGKPDTAKTNMHPDRELRRPFFGH